jgi:transposase
MLREAVKEEALSQARVYEWFSRLKRGDMSLEDQPRSGRPSTSRTDENIQKICDVIMFNRRRTLDELEPVIGVSWSSCQRILIEELHMTRVAALQLVVVR